jgi:hypothetical protein
MQPHHLDAHFLDAASQVNFSGPTFLPGLTVAIGAQIQCSPHPTKQFAQDFEVSDKSVSAVIQMRQALVKKAVSNTMSVSALPHKDNIYQCRHADVFLLNTRPPLLSIGPHTNSVLDQFGLDDKVLLKLHELISSVCSSCWEVSL